MIEKRRFFRFPVSLQTVLFTFEDGSKAEVSAENVSRGGIGLEVSEQDFQQGALVQMSLRLEDGKEPIIFSGKIAWVGCAHDSKKVGIEITKIDPAQKNEILEKAYKAWLNAESEKQRGCGSV